MDKATPGPAGEPPPPEAALPRVAKTPAPMMAPMPRAVRSTAVRALRRPCSSSPRSAMRRSRDFLRKRDIDADSFPPREPARRRREEYGRGPGFARRVARAGAPPDQGGPAGGASGGGGAARAAGGGRAGGA